MAEGNHPIGLQDKLKPSSEIHPVTRELIIGHWNKFGAKISIKPDDKLFAKLAVEAMSCSDEVSSSGQEFKGHEAVSLPSADGKAIARSALHKSIRYGRESDAIAYYKALVQSAGERYANRYIWHNIMFQDIGLADPVLCTVVGYAFRNNAHEDVLLHLIRLACRARKSRVQQDVWQPLYYSSFKEETKQEVRALCPNQTPDFVMSGKLTVIGGTVFLEKCKENQKNYSPFSEVLWDMDLPEFLRLACAEALNSKYRYWAPMVMLSCLYNEKWGNEQYSEDDPVVPFKIEKIKQVILPAIDWSTNQGKSAYRQLKKSRQDYFIQEDGKELTLKMFRGDIPRAESEVLCNRVGCCSSKNLIAEAFETCWKLEGRNTEAAWKYLRHLNRNLDPLNDVRRSVMK